MHTYKASITLVSKDLHRSLFSHEVRQKCHPHLTGGEMRHSKIKGSCKSQRLNSSGTTADQSCLGKSQNVSSPAEEQPCPFEFHTPEISNTRETKAQDIS